MDFRFSVQFRLSPGYHYSGDITAILASKHTSPYERLNAFKYISHEPHQFCTLQCESWEELNNDIHWWSPSYQSHQHHQHYNDGLVICKSEWNIFAVGKWRSLVIIWSFSITPRAGLVQPGAGWSSQDQHLLNVAVLTTGSRRSTFETATVKNQWCKHGSFNMLSLNWQKGIL